jgi:small-conductance mechanosensitive channel
MFSALLETQRAAVAALVFLATFVVAFSAGRYLKRRAGVRLGVLFRLFCLALAFYAALAAYGLQSDWRNHIGALLLLLSSAVFIALINHYLWDLYFERRKQTPIPHFLREVFALVIFLVALLLVLWYGYHAGRWLTGLLATSGVAAIIIGLAGQNLLGGIIAGMSLQINRPYRVGDWLQVGERFAEVMEINWRSTRLRTNDAVYLDIPNNEIVRQTIINLHYPTQLHAMRIRVGVDYNAPPNRVKDALFRAANTAEGVQKNPAAKVYLIEFADHAVVYEVKYFMLNHAAYNEVSDAIRTNIWYELKREDIRIPFPIRTLQMERRPAQPTREGHQEARSILRGDPLFQCLSDSQIDNLVAQSDLNHFGRGERVIEEGADGDSMFVLLRGAAQVAVSQNGATIPVATLRAGDCFGEMSLLTEEKRSATVRAVEDCHVMEIGKEAMGAVVRESPDCLRQLSEILARRKLETEGVLKEASISPDQAALETEYRGNFLRRLKALFEL